MAREGSHLLAVVLALARKGSLPRHYAPLSVHRSFNVQPAGPGRGWRVTIAGIDYSTHAIDIVTIPHDDAITAPEWHTFPLQGDNAFDRARDVANELHGRHSMFWDEILAVGIEQPGGHQRDVMARVQGAILSCIPARMLVQLFVPTQWRHLAGLKGSSSKDEVRAASELLLPFGVRFDTQDAHDAHLIAIATRSQISNTVST